MRVPILVIVPDPLAAAQLGRWRRVFVSFPVNKTRAYQSHTPKRCILMETCWPHGKLFVLARLVLPRRHNLVYPVIITRAARLSIHLFVSCHITFHARARSFKCAIRLGVVA
jgi:hypothetical protein